MRVKERAIHCWCSHLNELHLTITMLDTILTWSEIHYAILVGAIWIRLAEAVEWFSNQICRVDQVALDLLDRDRSIHDHQGKFWTRFHLVLIFTHYFPLQCSSRRTLRSAESIQPLESRQRSSATSRIRRHVYVNKTVSTQASAIETLIRHVIELFRKFSNKGGKIFYLLNLALVNWELSSVFFEHFFQRFVRKFKDISISR